MLASQTELGTNPAAWIALATLVAMEVGLRYRQSHFHFGADKLAARQSARGRFGRACSQGIRLRCHGILGRGGSA